MGLRASSWAWDQDLPSSPKFVLVALAEHADDNGLCWPSVARLAQRTGLKERAVRNALRTLEDAQLVRTERRDGFMSRYTLAIGASPVAVAARADDLAEVTEDEGAALGAGGHQMPGGTTCRGASGASLPGTSCRPPRHLAQGTPAPRAPEPSRTITEPSMNRQTRPRRGRGADDLGPEFDEFWRLYPRKEGKGQAKRAWLAALRKVGGDAEAILIGLKARLDTFAPKPAPGATDFRRHPATWLNGECWTDDEEPEPAAPVARPVSAAVH